MSAVYPPQPNQSQPGSQPMPLPALPLEIWGATDKGRVRDSNEDAVYPHSGVETLPFKPAPERLQQKGYLLLVADGVGGNQAGSEASRWARRVAVERYYDLPGPDLGADLQAAVGHANASLYQYLQSTGTPEAGSTMVAAVIHGNTLHIANVGDSRAYLIRDGHISQQTIDHTLTQQKIERGLIRPEQAETDPDRSVLTRSLGAGPVVQVDLFPSLQLVPGDTVLLCSDGLTDMLEDEEIARVVSRSSPKRAAQRLIAAANKRGGFDNISVVIARVGGKAQPAAGGGLLAGLGRMSAGQKAIVASLAALVVLVFCGLMGWTMRALLTGRPTPVPTSAPTATVEMAPATMAPTMPVEVLPTDTAPPGAPTSTPRPTTTPTYTPRPPTPTLTPMPTATSVPPTPTTGGGGGGGGGGGTQPTKTPTKPQPTDTPTTPPPTDTPTTPPPTDTPAKTPPP